MEGAGLKAKGRAGNMGTRAEGRKGKGIMRGWPTSGRKWEGKGEGSKGE